MQYLNLLTNGLYLYLTIPVVATGDSVYFGLFGQIINNFGFYCGLSNTTQAILSVYDNSNTNIQDIFYTSGDAVLITCDNINAYITVFSTNQGTTMVTVPFTSYLDIYWQFYAIGNIISETTTFDNFVYMANGSKGDTGPTGYTGAKGDTGYTGSRGDTGTKGDTGAIGTRGDTGYTGPQGYNGYTGTQGPQGDTGPQGFAGNGLILYLNTTSQTPPGQGIMQITAPTLTSTGYYTDTNTFNIGDPLGPPYVYTSPADLQEGYVILYVYIGITFQCYLTATLTINSYTTTSSQVYQSQINQYNTNNIYAGYRSNYKHTIKFCIC